MTLSSCTNIYTNIHSLSQFCTCHNLQFFLCLTTGVLQLWIILFWWFLHNILCLFVCLVLKIYAVCVGNYSFSKKFQEIPVRKIIFWCFKFQAFHGGWEHKIYLWICFSKRREKNLKNDVTLLSCRVKKYGNNCIKLGQCHLRMTKSSL